MDANRCVILLSGGLDSATVLAMALEEGSECHTLAFDYGQRHRHELRSAERLSRAMGAASHKVVRVDLRAIGGSSLTSEMKVAKDGSGLGRGMEGGIPATYVPARNLVFLAIATGYAETLGAGRVEVGVNAVDYSGYPDCRPEFVEAFERVARLATKVGVEGGRIRIAAPLMKMGKGEIIARGARLGVDYSLTHSCYDPEVEIVAAAESGEEVERVLACGLCDSCRLRRLGFEQAGVKDPTAYAGGRRDKASGLATER